MNDAARQVTSVPSNGKQRSRIAITLRVMNLAGGPVQQHKVQLPTSVGATQTWNKRMSHWVNADSPWNHNRVGHLHRRTAFGATPAEIERDLNIDPQQAVTRILDGTARQETPEAFFELADVIGKAAADSPNSNRLKAWWLYRCRNV
jgi:hypothetical protein